jgi:hypothetical protein
MKKVVLIIMTIICSLSSCHQQYENKIVICIPVYGQSLALGEEAERITDFDSLAQYAGGRIVTENLDHNFGYFDNGEIKLFAKKIIGYQKRAFELSVYNMAMIIADNTGNDTIICIFPGGQGATAIANLSKGTDPYIKFMNNIENAYQEALSRGWSFYVPAICWMQGESDIVDYPNTQYQQQLKKIWSDMNIDILNITQQKDSIPFICYQANSLTRAKNFHANNYFCRETEVPQAFVNLLNHDKWFWSSGPTYPYTCVNDIIHIDAEGQQQIGKLAAISVLRILKGGMKNYGLVPTQITTDKNEVIVQFNVPQPPLKLDTINVRKVENYGFSVITPNNKNIATGITIDGNFVHITCSQSPNSSHVRYAVNGEYMKSGRLYGPRGNLCDFKGNWCYMFDILCN